MRGVFLTPGEHTIEFRFQPPCGPLYVSLAAIAVGILLAAYLLYARFAPPQAAAQARPRRKLPAAKSPGKREVGPTARSRFALHSPFLFVHRKRCLPVKKPWSVAQNTARNNSGLTISSSGVFQLFTFHASTLVN